jgi:hypothetical protein
MQHRRQEIFAYEDSSSDDEGPGGSSLYWQLAKGHQKHYKAVLRAMRRARVRSSYIEYLSTHGFRVSDQPTPKEEGEHSHVKVGLEQRDKGGALQAVLGMAGRCLELPMVFATEAVVTILHELQPTEPGIRTLSVPALSHNPESFLQSTPSSCH